MPQEIWCASRPVWSSLTAELVEIQIYTPNDLAIGYFQYVLRNESEYIVAKCGETETGNLNRNGWRGWKQQHWPEDLQFIRNAGQTILPLY
jgi:hypothetical protein